MTGAVLGEEDLFECGFAADEVDEVERCRPALTTGADRARRTCIRRDVVLRRRAGSRPRSAANVSDGTGPVANLSSTWWTDRSRSAPPGSTWTNQAVPDDRHAFAHLLDFVDEVRREEDRSVFRRLRFVDSRPYERLLDGVEARRSARRASSRSGLVLERDDQADLLLVALRCLRRNLAGSGPDRGAR